MTIADEARDNAIHCEMVKYAYRQSKDGVVVSFVVHPNDVPAALSTSHIGSRYMVALVQVGDDERPIPLAAKETKNDRRLVSPSPRRLDKPAGAKRDWQDRQPSQQAYLVGRSPVFWAFLTEQKGYKVASEEDAKEAVYELCEIQSRRDLDVPENARQLTIWNLLYSAYRAWEIVGA